MANINRQIAEELGVREQQIEATVTLLDGGATVPFVARYRKEITGGLDDAQLRTLEERLNYLRELEARRTAILDSIREQGKLDAALEAAILAADSKGRLEDIYLPFKPKRRTKAEIAKEAGLEPLAELLLTHPENDPQAAAAPFVNADKEVADAAAALEGARAILVERFAEDADLLGALREQMWSNGLVTSKVRTGKKTEGEKFKDYFDFNEPLHKLPSHRILALFRGEKEEILDLQIQPDAQAPVAGVPSSYELKIMQRFAVTDRGRPGDRWLAETVRWAWRTKIQVHLNVDLRMRLWTAAETEGVRVFASNLRDLLLAAPAGARVTLGLDPGYRSGVKVAVVDATGKVLDTTAVYPHEPQKRWDEALATLGKLAVKHRVDLIAIGNGTASRETDRLAVEMVKLLPDLKMSKIVVSEAGASVYSASAFASEELPELVATFFRLSDRRDDTFVAGLSMGGYGALKWALRHPERFAAAASLSGAVDVERLRAIRVRTEDPRLFDRVFGDQPVAGTADDLWWLLEQTDPATLPALWVGCGTRDPLYSSNENFVAACTTGGIPVTTSFVPGEHDWGLWDQQIEQVLAWLPLDAASLPR